MNRDVFLTILEFVEVELFPNVLFAGHLLGFGSYVVRKFKNKRINLSKVSDPDIIFWVADNFRLKGTCAFKALQTCCNFRDAYRAKKYYNQYKFWSFPKILINRLERDFRGEIFKI